MQKKKTEKDSKPKASYGDKLLSIFGYDKGAAARNPQKSGPTKNIVERNRRTKKAIDEAMDY